MTPPGYGIGLACTSLGGRTSGLCQTRAMGPDSRRQALPGECAGVAYLMAPLTRCRQTYKGTVITGDDREGDSALNPTAPLIEGTPSTAIVSAGSAPGGNA